MIENKKRTPKRLIMVIEEVLSDEVLQQAAVELAIAINGNLLVPAECQHCFFLQI